MNEREAGKQLEEAVASGKLMLEVSTWVSVMRVLHAVSHT